jgi:hypothetical protein
LGSPPLRCYNPPAARLFCERGTSWGIPDEA